MFILAFKNPALLPVLRGRPAPPPFPPSQARSCPVPPAAPSSSPSSSPRSSSCGPLSPTLLGRGRGGGSEKRFVRLAAPLRPGGRGLGGAQRPVALPPPRGRSHPAPASALLLRQRSQPGAREEEADLVFEEERVSESQGGRFSLYKQEAYKPLAHCSISDCTRRRGRPCLSTVSPAPSAYLFPPGPPGLFPPFRRPKDSLCEPKDVQGTKDIILAHSPPPFLCSFARMA